MIIIVTGASSGFGSMIKEELCREGHTVYGTSRRADGSDPYMLRLDVTDAAQAQSVVDIVLEREGRVDVLVNNAGMGVGGAAELATVEEVKLQMDTNFTGVTNMCRAVLPAMRRQRSGRIINMSSIAGRFAVPFQGLYSASKFAVEGYSQALQIETYKLGIKVVCVNPGDFKTGFTSQRIINEASLTDKDYAASFESVKRNIERDEQNGGDPRMVARRVAGIVKTPHPRFHYIVASDPLQAVAVFLSVILPKRFFFWILRLFYSCK